MTFLDIFAAGCAAVASLLMALRSIMLKPDMPSWCDAPALVRLSIVFASAVWAGVALDILRSGHASSREMIAFGAIALSAGALLINLWGQDCQSAQEGDNA